MLPPSEGRLDEIATGDQDEADGAAGDVVVAESSKGQYPAPSGVCGLSQDRFEVRVAEGCAVV